MAVVLGALLLGAVGVGIWLWSELQERQRQLAEARVLRKLAVVESQRQAALMAAELPSARVASLDRSIDELRREAVEVREKTEKMSNAELSEAFNKLIRRTLVYIFVALSFANTARAQEVVPLDHEGERGVWMPESDAQHILSLAMQTDRYARTVQLMEERLRLSDQVIANLRLAIGHGDEAMEAARQIAFASEARAIEAENAASSPWPKVLGGLAGGVLGAAIAVVLTVVLLGGG